MGRSDFRRSKEELNEKKGCHLQSVHLDEESGGTPMTYDDSEDRFRDEAPPISDPGPSTVSFDYTQEKRFQRDKVQPYLFGGFALVCAAIGFGCAFVVRNKMNANQGAAVAVSTTTATMVDQGCKMPFYETMCANAMAKLEIPSCLQESYTQVRAIASSEFDLGNIVTDSCSADNLALISLATAVNTTTLNASTPAFNNGLRNKFIMTTMYYSMGGPRWFDDDGWLSAESVCHWHGIACNPDEEVKSIEIMDNNLGGTIPSSISLLTSMSKYEVTTGPFHLRVQTTHNKFSKLH